MADDTIRPHDPFSGHETPAPADDTVEPEQPAQVPAPPPEPTVVPKPRRGRRPRRVPTAAEMEQARTQVKK